MSSKGSLTGGYFNTSRSRLEIQKTRSELTAQIREAEEELSQLRENLRETEGKINHIVSEMQKTETKNSKAKWVQTYLRHLYDSLTCVTLKIWCTVPVVCHKLIEGFEITLFSLNILNVLCYKIWNLAWFMGFIESFLFTIWLAHAVSILCYWLIRTKVCVTELFWGNEAEYCL